VVRSDQKHGRNKSRNESRNNKAGPNPRRERTKNVISVEK